MTWQEALDIVVARTGHGRYRDLCADAHPDRELWRSRMIEKAGGDPPPARPDAPRNGHRPDVATTMGRVRAMKACAFRSTEGCGCSGARCALKGGAVVTHVDCFACVARYG